MSLSSPLGKGAPLLSRMVAPALRYQHPFEAVLVLNALCARLSTHLTLDSVCVFAPGLGSIYVQLRSSNVRTAFQYVIGFCSRPVFLDGVESIAPWGCREVYWHGHQCIDSNIRESLWHNSV